jgi:hypothetical protein
VPSTTDLIGIYGSHDNSYDKNYQAMPRLIVNGAIPSLMNVKRLPAKKYNFDRTFTDVCNGFLSNILEFDNLFSLDYFYTFGKLAEVLIGKTNLIVTLSETHLLEMEN